jgi:hypothetical protein
MADEASKDQVLVMNSTAVTTRGFWIKFEKAGGAGNPSSSRVWTQMKPKLFPFLMLRGGLT